MSTTIVAPARYWYQGRLGILRLALADLSSHGVTWIGAFAVAVVCGYIGGWAVSFQETAAFYSGNLSNSLEGSVLSVALFSLLAAVIVLTLAARLTVSLQQRSYALWQLVNVKPRLVSVIVLLQLTVVGFLGAVFGTLLTLVTFEPLFPWVFSSYDPTAQVVPHVGVSLMPTVWLVVVSVFLLGGLKGARRAGKTPPLTILREPKEDKKGMTRIRVLLFVGLVLCTCKLAVFMAESGPAVALNYSLYVPILVVAALASIAPLAFSALLSLWTSLVPHARWNAWYLARHNARRGLNTSVSIETPVMVGFGFVAGIFSLINVMGIYVQQQGITNLNTTLDWTSTLLLLGGPMLLCAVGSAVSVIMSSKSRARDTSLLVALGTRPATLLAAAVCEALIHAGTATLAGMGATVISIAIIAYAVDVPLSAGLAFGEGLVVSLLGFALVLVATLVPTGVALKQETAAALTVRE